jgi:hypothetical protein
MKDKQLCRSEKKHYRQQGIAKSGAERLRLDI